MEQPQATNEGTCGTPGLTDGFGAGWSVEHHMYGKWFMPRAGVVADWKEDHAQAYPDEPRREPETEEVETWFAEQITWIEVRIYGRQIARPDMAAVERHWLELMSGDMDYIGVERSVVEVGPVSNAKLSGPKGPHRSSHES